MPTKRKGKTAPCEGCRERKKKCTADRPCERCKRLDIQCYYLKPVAPSRVDYIDLIDNIENQHRVEILEDIMRTMEREVRLLKSPFLLKQRISNTRQQSKTDSEAAAPNYYYSCSDDDFDNTHMNHHQLPTSASPQQHSNEIQNWEMTIGSKEGISINTNILSYASLLKNIETLGENVAKFYSIVKQPTLASLSTGGGYLHRNVLSSILRKGNFQATMKCIKNIEAKRQQQLLIEAVPPSAVAGNDNRPTILLTTTKNLTQEIVHTYFQCRFLHRVIFHQKTFFEMFINNRTDLEESPVVCALCSAVLTMRCKHVMAIVPFDQQLVLAEYYFNKARSAVSQQFDEPSMETMIVYIHMSLYKENLLRPKEANMYLEMAIRIRHILADEILKVPPTHLPNSAANHTTTVNTCNGTNKTTIPNTPKKAHYTRYAGEYETFKRLHVAFQDAVQFIQFVNNQRGIPLKNSSINNPNACSGEYRAFQQFFQSICIELYDPNPFPDESRETIRAIMKERYIGLIVQAIRPYINRLRWGQDDMIPLSFLMKTEEDLNRVYHQQTPLDYRLDPSIFEEGISDLEFKKRLSEDGRCDIASVTLAARYYQSLLALHEPYLPVIKKNLSKRPDIYLLQDDESNEALVNKSRKRKQKEYTAESLTTSSSEDDDDCNHSTVLSVHSLHAQKTCFKYAITVVRLLEYQCTVLEACTIPVPSLLCAWDILIRNSCLGMTEEDLDESGIYKYLSREDIKLSQEYAIRCIEVLRRGWMFNGAERDLWKYYENIESQLLTALSKSTSPTVKFWEPVSSW